VVFSWDGIGSLTWDALQKRDFPVLQGVFLILATVVIFANFVADIISLYLDPRLKT
jgi:peptide/nickel transport system permease protein